MKIKSIATLKENLNPATQNVLITNNFEIPVGKTFVVYGISIWEGVLSYLTVEEDGNPFWFPAELFVVEDTMLPMEFHHNYFGLQDKRGLNALWGYEEMVMDDQHYIDLIERVPEAREIFNKRKNEIDDN